MKKYTTLKLVLILFICAIGFTKTNAQSIITTGIGDSTGAYTGDGGPASNAQLNEPHDVCMDAAGNLYIADMGNHVIRKVTKATGIINTIAGTGIAGYSGDGGLAVNAELTSPSYMCLDAAGNLYFSDGGEPTGAFPPVTGNYTVRKIAAATGKISTVAGTGVSGYTGDGGLATAAELQCPQGICLDAQGNLYIVDWLSNCVRKVTASTGIITTIAGTGTLTFGTTAVAPLLVALTMPQVISIIPSGDIFISDWGGAYMRKLSASTGLISTFAGTGGLFSGDHGPAINAGLGNVTGLCVDCHGDLYCNEWSCSCRKISMPSTIINIVAGDSAIDGYSGDGGPSLSALLDFPAGLCVDPSNGNIIIADAKNNRVRMATQPGFVPVTTNVNNLALGSQPLIFPNPSTGKIAVKISEDLKSSEMQIFDALGKIVKTATLTDSKTTFDISTLPEGVYFISVRSSLKTYTQRLVLTK